MRALLLGTSSAGAGAAQRRVVPAAKPTAMRLRTVSLVMATVSLVMADPLKYAEESARGRRAERCHGTVVALHDELLCRCRRQSPAGRRFVEEQLRRFGFLKSGLQCGERASGRAIHIEHRDEPRLHQRTPKRRHGPGVDGVE